VIFFQGQRLEKADYLIRGNSDAPWMTIARFLGESDRCLFLMVAPHFGFAHVEQIVGMVVAAHWIISWLGFDNFRIGGG
jgi:hypothetical protein